jgi:hypothetical protein
VQVTAERNVRSQPLAQAHWQLDPIDAARVAIWRLFQEGYVDEDMATAGLLAVDLGTRRAQRKTPNVRVQSGAEARPLPD